MYKYIRNDGTQPRRKALYSSLGHIAISPWLINPIDWLIGSIYTSYQPPNTMRKARIQIARQDIIQHFDQHPSKVFQYAAIAHELSAQRAFWRLTQSTTTSAFIKFLESTGRLSEIVFPFPPPYKKKTRYAWGTPPIYEVMLALKPDCYFSHYSAMHIHGLTEQMPKTFYLNDEQRLESWLAGKLSQKSIDAAFRRPVRVTNQIATDT